MKFIVQSIHFDADSKLVDFIQKKVDKLGTFYDDIIGGEVFLRLDKSTTQDNKIVEIKLNVPGKDLFAKKQSKTFEEATEIVVEALKTQIEKKKSK
jgi:putative sigma-54 modulation protein